MSSRVGPLLMAIASFSMRILDRADAADILGVAALAALTIGLRRTVPFQPAARAIVQDERVPQPAASSVPAR